MTLWWNINVYYYYYYYFNPGGKSLDFKNYKKSVKLERLLMRLINQQKTVVQQNRINALHRHRQTLKQKKNSHGHRQM